MSYFERNIELCGKRHAHLLSCPSNDVAADTQLLWGHDFTQWQMGDRQGTFAHGSKVGHDQILSERGLYVLYGLGDGEFAQRLAADPRVRELIIFEPSQKLFQEVLKTRDCSWLLENDHIALIVGNNTTRYLSEIRSAFVRNVRRYILAGNFANLLTPGCERLPGFGDMAQKFAESFRTAVDNFTVEFKTPSEDAYRGLMHTLENARSFAQMPSVDALRGAFRGFPGIVVGSGPSLTHSLPYLRELSREVVMVSCDSTLKGLLEGGITPHFVACMERVRETRALFDQLKIPTECRLVAPPTVSPETFRAFSGQSVGMCRDIGFDAWLFPESERYFMGLSAGHLALMICSLMGCSPIYLVGIDGAYDPQTRSSHHESCPALIRAHGERIRENRESLSNIEVSGYDGKPKLTMTYWLWNAQVTSEIISRGNLEVAHITPVSYSLPIAGARRADPESLAVLEKKRSQIDVKLAVLGEFRPDPLVAERLQKRLEHGCEYLHDVQMRCLKAMQEISLQWFGKRPNVNHQHELYNSFFSRIEKEQESLLTDAANFSKILFPLVQGTLALKSHAFHEVARTELDPAVRVEKQLRQLMEWFETLTLWSVRAHYLVSQEASRECI